MSSRALGRIAALVLAALVAGCGGGGGSSSAVSPAPTPAPTPAPAAANTVAVIVDNGPAELDTGPDPYVASDTVFVSVTICAPGTSICQTVDHVQIDTGSVGLRLYQSVLGASLLAALPRQTSPAGNPVGECYGFVDGYIFGAVRTADVTVGTEKVAGLPFQVIGDTSLSPAIPASCSAGGGNNIDSVKALGSNGIYGVGVTTTDCGSACATGGSGAAIYYDCPSSGCAAVIARAANETAPFEQLPNPVAALAVDNNGLILSLPAAAAGGSPSVSGTMFFGIGTQANNGLGAAKVIATTNSSNPAGAGFVTAIYKGQTFSQSYLDSGSNAYYFVDASIPTCTATGFKGYYCPAQPLALSAAIQLVDGTSVAAPFTIYNAQTLFSNNNNAALPTLGANPDLLNSLAPYPNSFDFGLPFFFGRNIYVAFEGRAAAGTPGPYFAY